MKRLFVWMAVIGAALGFLASAATADGPADCTNVETDKGAVTGKLNDKKGVCIYKGIPYAAPPVGKLRWVVPQPHEPWSEPLKASKFGNECLQYPIALTPSKKPSGKEDCLYLNVWQPLSAAKEKKPVMVFIHGGGFVLGSGSQEWYESSNLSSKGDVVAVTINYRLNAFGFMVHSSLRDSEGRIGNYGLYDQIAALKWVHDNISNFGGDPNNVTIFGESAGGMSVSLHLISPLSRGLFQKAIIQSGPVLLMNKTVSGEEKTGIDAAASLGCSDPAAVADCLRAADPVKLMTTLHPYSALMSDAEMTQGFAFNPIVDGFVMPEAPIKLMQKGNYATDVKIMIGTNRDEATLFTMKKKLDTPEEVAKSFAEDTAKVGSAFGLDLSDKALLNFYSSDKYPTPRAAYNDMVSDIAFTCPSRAHANLLVANQPDVYLYRLVRPLATTGFFKDLGVFHGADIAFVFGNFSFMGINVFSPENGKLSDDVIALWTSFAKTGKPSTPGVPEWPRFSPAKAPFLTLDIQSTVSDSFKLEQCKAVEKIISNAFSK